MLRIGSHVHACGMHDKLDLMQAQERKSTAIEIPDNSVLDFLRN